MCLKHAVAFPAIKYDPSNVQYLWERSSLYEQVGEHKQAMDGYRRILSLLPPSDGEQFMQLSRDMAKYGAHIYSESYDDQDFYTNIKTLQTVFATAPL